MKFAFISALGFSFILLLSSCNKQDTDRPNIVFVLTDQWRAQATGYSEDPNLSGRTPNLDRIAETGINFRNAVSVCPVCTPYRASLLTGQYPTSTGMFFNDIHLPEESLTMAEIFKDEGYSTAYIGKWHLDGMGRSAFTPPERRQGFDYWKGLECSHDYNDLLYYAGKDTSKQYWEGYGPYAETEDAIRYLKDHSEDEEPFLLFISYGIPHFPHHSAPEEFKDLFREEDIILRANVPAEMEDKAREESVGYYSHIMALDKCLGDIQKVLVETGLRENTIFVFTSDHGEMMGSQGIRPKQKQKPWAESVRVPFLLSYPALYGDKNISVGTPINTPDILPTLLSLSNISIPESLEGIDLSETIGDPDARPDRAALIMNISPFADAETSLEYRGIYTEKYSYVRNLEGPWFLFDSKNDPLQINNLLDNAEYSKVQEEMDLLLWKEMKKIGDEFKPREYYIEKWGYKINEYGYIPYFGKHEFQGPGMNEK